MAKKSILIQKDDNIKINYLLENLDTKEETLMQDIIVNVSTLDTALQERIISSMVGSWFSVDLEKVCEERLLRINTSKYKNVGVGEYVVLDVQNEDNHKVIGKLIKKTTKYTIFDLKTPLEDGNWRVSVEILEVIR